MMTREDIINKTYAEFWNVRDEYKHHSLDELKTIVKNDRLPFAVCVINVTGELNVGIIMRSAALLGAERFIIYGRQSYDKRSTVGSQNYIDVIKVGNISRDSLMTVNYDEFYPTMEKYNYRPVFVETGGIPVKQFLSHNSFWSHDNNTPKPCLVFGNEGVGIDQCLLMGHEHDIVTVPQRGVLRSYNVSAAANIIMYEFAQQATFLTDPNYDNWK